MVALQLGDRSACDARSRGKVHLRKQVERSAPSVHRYDPCFAENGADGLLDVIEVAASSIGFIALKHPAPLGIAHGVESAKVGEVQEHLLLAQLVRIVTGAFQRLPPLFIGGYGAERSDSLGTVRLHRRGHSPAPRCGKRNYRRTAVGEMSELSALAEQP